MAEQVQEKSSPLTNRKWDEIDDQIAKNASILREEDRAPPMDAGEWKRFKKRIKIIDA